MGGGDPRERERHPHTHTYTHTRTHAHTHAHTHTYTHTCSRAEAQTLSESADGSEPEGEVARVDTVRCAVLEDKADALRWMARQGRLRTRLHKALMRQSWGKTMGGEGKEEPGSVGCAASSCSHSLTWCQTSASHTQTHRQTHRHTDTQTQTQTHTFSMDGT